MKTLHRPKNTLPALALSLAAFMGFGPVALTEVAARIGDDKATFEQRLLRNKRAAKYTKNTRSRETVDEAERGGRFRRGGRNGRDEDNGVADNMLDRKLKSLEFREHLDWFPEQIDIEVYYKAVGDVHANTKTMVAEPYPPGWEVQVVFIGGKSALESFRRSEKLTEPEFFGLMKLNSSGGAWREGTPLEVEPGQKVPEGEEENVTAFGYDYERRDGLVRCRKVGNTVWFFATAFDRAIFKKRAEAAEGIVPESLEGF